MAGYKVSYKILRQQGEDMKAVAKLVDGYAERVAQVGGKLGEGELLAEVRTNLSKLREQLGESRTVLNTAGEFLVKTVDSYTGVELRQVKKTDSTRAHNRDFYKNPVVVASAGGAVSGAAATVSSPAVSTPTPAPTTVNYTDNSVNVSNVAVQSAPAAVDAQPIASQTTAPPVVNTAATPAPSAPTSVAAPVIPETAKAGMSGIAAGVGVAGGAIGAGTVLGVKHLADQDKKSKSAVFENAQSNGAKDDYDPEAELAAALERVRMLEEEE